jgi:hypothetical protein
MREGCNVRKFFALLIVIFSVNAAVAWDGGYVVPPAFPHPPDDPYWRGIEVNSSNPAEAMKWYRIAADQGDARAQDMLGVAYEGGVAVPRNYAEAIKWWPYGPSENVYRSGAIEQRNLVGRKMTLAQITQAQKLASEWKPKLERAQSQ